MATINDLVRAADAGDGAAAEELFAALYNELHAQAEHHLRTCGPRMTLGTTTLLHESYIKLANRSDLRFPDRARFLGYASRALRGLVIDYARARRARKRGGEFEIVRLGDEEPPAPETARDDALERIGRALDELAEIDPHLANLVDLHFFGGFSFVEIAALHDQSERTVQRNWRKARMILQPLVADQ